MLSSVVIQVIIFLQSGMNFSLELFNRMENIFRALCALAKLLDDLRCPILPVNHLRLLDAPKGKRMYQHKEAEMDLCRSPAGTVTQSLKVFKLLVNFDLGR